MLSISGQTIRIKGTDETVATDLVCLLKVFKQEREHAYNIALMTLAVSEVGCFKLRYDKKGDD